MTYKTILVHLNDERRVAGIMDVACQLAGRFDAHVAALYVMPALPSFGPATFSAGLVQSGLQAFKEQAQRVQKAFEAAVQGRPIVSEWRLFEPGEEGVAECVLEHARRADLVIAGQRDTSFEFTRSLDVPERLALDSGRPVLVVPKVGRYPHVGKRVSVAWNGRRESARAVFDALPLLQGADNVRIVWIDPQAERGKAGDLPGADLAMTLSRHGVKCEAATAVASDIDVGDVILSGLTDDGADLLVMGAYGHSRMRELVFGGVTRHIFEHMTVPVLFSH